ncbi:response regulator [Algoriphagus lutimaris]|uniref:response regulator n=1 Tax=Algoriphagus lutimaris TaxID=613197 RepID=UPI00196A1F1B|nr:response regulator [Algoriphagus lutimaris]MBN3519788.1 response regulator [Algoriphagus lutimaris]
MKSKRVLIVDDNDLNRKLFENLIGQLCYFKSVKNGIEALDILKVENFDLILMDIQMPQMDGMTAMKQIKISKLTESPIIAVTAFAELEDKNNFLDQGFDDFIVKPIRPREFIECIKETLSRNPTPQKVQNETTSETLSDLILDVQVIKQLMKYNSTEIIKNVYLDFLKECEKLVEDSQNSFSTSDLQSIEDHLHIIKGNSGTLGANKIFKLSQKGELHAKNSNWAETKKILQQLQNEILIFREYLNEETIFES